MGNKDISITEEQLAAVVASAVTAALAAQNQQTRPQAFVEASPNEQFEAMMRGRRGLDEPKLPVVEVPNCKSHVTGATFTARITRGIVTEIAEYKHPAGTDLHIDQGGLVTNGLEIKDTHGQLHPHYKQWLWENFWQLDIRTHVGRALPKYVQPEPEAVPAEATL